VRWFALGGIAGPALFAIVVVICGAMRPEYSHSAQFVSELGATGTPHARFMNFIGFIPAGALVGALGLSLAAALPRDRASLGAGVLLGLFGLGLILAGSIPCAPGCPQEALTLHDGVSVAAFLSAIGAVGISAYRFRLSRQWRTLWLYSALSGGAALCFLVALAASIETRSLTGLWQRLLIGTLFLWCAVAGLRAFRLGGRHEHAA